MELKKPQIIIFIFLALWVVLIGWGLIKTTFKLSKQETPIEEGDSSDKKTGIASFFSGDKKDTTDKTKAPPGTKQQTESPPVIVRTFKAQKINFSDSLPLMGTVKGETEIDLRFEIEGVIDSINFKEGEQIKKGDLIAALKPKDAQLKLEYVQNKLASAEASYQSTLKKLEVHQQLYQAGAIIKSKLEEVELSCKSAKFELETIKSEEKIAKNDMEKTSLFATLAGVMGPREAEEGEYITPQDKVGSLLEVANVLIEVGVVERDINKIRIGQKAKVYVDAYPNITFEGKIENIFPIVEGKSRTLTAKIKVLNIQGMLLPGMFCRADVSIIELKDAIIVPATSIITTGRDTNLLSVIPAHSIKIDEDDIKTGTVELRTIKVGYFTSDYAQITEGIEENDLAIIEAQGEIKENSSVRISAIEEMNY